MPSDNLSDSPFAANLNPRQREAVLHRAGPLMIIAGAGTGKTRVITHRIAFLAREVGIPIQEIMAVTFTNKAAKEMRERVCRLLDEPDSPGLAIGTFHSRCAMILRRDAGAAGLDANFAILDDSDQKQAIKRALKELDISAKLVTPGQVQSFINNAKMKLLTPADTAAEFDEDQVPYPAIYKRYQELLEQAKSLDFEDLLMRTVLLFQEDEAVRRKWSSRYRYLLVDEYQDTNHAQFLLTKLLTGEHRDVCVVGDEDQSIYSWRGAEISNLLDFEKAFPGTTIVKLEQNYRSTGNILKAASTVIARNTQRIGKELFTELEDGDTISFLRHYDQEQEARAIAGECLALIHRGVSPSELAIFYRSHWLSRAVEDAMRTLRVPYRIVGGIRFYDRQEIKDLLSFLRLAVNPHDDLAMERVINRPIRGVGDKTVSNIGMRAGATGTSWFDAARAMLRDGEIKGKARTGLDDFLAAVARWNAMARASDPEDILDRILADTDYRKQGVGDPGSIEGESRLENIDELHGLVQAHIPEREEFRLAEFLNRMSLDSSEEKDDGRPKVNLLTIHNAKGLEFDHVFIVGLEHRVFPTGRAEDNEDLTAIEEERRLFYVALTRARKKLHLNYATTRNRGDYFGGGEPSRFLSELPASAFDPESQQTLARLLPHAFGRGSELGGSRPGIGGGTGRRVVGDDEIFTPLDSAMPSPRTAGRDRRTSFQVGDRVVHRIMGQGEIVELGGRRGWERAVIQFDDGRVQDFVLKFAPIEPAPR